jgi:hypothetical protein
VSSAVQVKGRPTSRWSAKTSWLEKTPPGSNATTPRPHCLTGSSKARSSARSATREGTGRPLSPLWVGDALDANPAAPPAMASATTACMVAISSSVAGRSYASSPMT